MDGQLRLVGSAGANRAMEAELKRLAARALGRRLEKPRRATPQSLVFPFEPDLAWLAVRYARTPSRVLWDLFRVEARRLEPLHDALLAHLETDAPWLEAGQTFSVEVRRSEAFAAGPLQIRGVVKNALLEASGRRGRRLRLDAETPDLVVRVEADGEGATISLDLGGRSLHLRGHRRHVAEASLKETLAAQMLILARWDPRREALVDPMAGAGTLLLEGAGAAVGAATWPLGTSPAAARFPPFSGRDLAAPELFPGTHPPLVAIEVHTPAQRALRANLAEAGLEDRILAVHADFRDVPGDALGARLPEGRLPERGLVVVNPPYGERLERGRGHDPELLALYKDLRDWWRALGAGWRIALLGPRRPLMAVFGDRPRLDKPLKNGPLSVTLLVYEG
jgi:23S rRNA G2445 N2-methylase RlmL